MWNNTNLPLAYLITFRCYGTWLHGDERGSVDRFRNQSQWSAGVNITHKPSSVSLCH
jgi:hypothetical protein